LFAASAIMTFLTEFNQLPLAILAWRAERTTKLGI
jgi:hypothetical protein